MSSETGNPVRKAQIRLSAAEIRVNRSSTTDNEGRYELSGLPAGRYHLQIAKAGYVTLEYGQARPFEAGKPIDLADGAALNNIDFSLPRGSVITGRVADEFGDPVVDATVQAMRFQFVNGQRQLVAAGRQATTDDIGQYRIFGLMPGEYLVRASVRGGGVPGGGPGGAQSTEEPAGYPPAYFPGTPDVAQAQPVTVALGQELSSVFISLAPARLARISGSVVDSHGRVPGGAIVVLRSANRSGGPGLIGALGLGGGSQVRADGTFALTSVPPGEFLIEVQQRPRGPQAAGGDLEFASVPVTVSGSDITGLAIVTTPGVAVSGHVVLQGQKPQSVSLRSIQIAATAPSGMQSIMGIAGSALGGGRVAEDGTFQLRGLAGPQVIRVSNIPAGWALQSIVLDGQNLTDTPFDFKGGRDLTGMTVTLTDRLTDLSGSVHDSRGQVVKDYVMVVFPEDSRLWGGQSRFVRTARPNQDGAYNIKGLPPAKYLAVAVEALENGTQSDAAVLESLKPKAKPFALSEGQTLTLDLSF